jgi:hypothetical protein
VTGETRVFHIAILGKSGQAFRDYFIEVDQKADQRMRKYSTSRKCDLDEEYVGVKDLPDDIVLYNSVAVKLV